MTTTGRGLVVVARVELCLAGLALLAVQHDTTGFPRRARHHRTLRGFLGSIVADATRRVPRTLEVALQWQGRAQQAQIKCKSALNLFWSSGFKIGARKSRRAALGISPGELDFWGLNRLNAQPALRDRRRLPTRLAHSAAAPTPPCHSSRSLRPRCPACRWTFRAIATASSSPFVLPKQRAQPCAQVLRCHLPTISSV